MNDTMQMSLFEEEYKQDEDNTTKFSRSND